MPIRKKQQSESGTKNPVRKKKTDSVYKFKEIVNTLTTKRGLIFIGILSLFSILEMVYNKESSLIHIIKIIIQFLFFVPSS